MGFDELPAIIDIIDVDKAKAVYHSINITRPHVNLIKELKPDDHVIISNYKYVVVDWVMGYNFYKMHVLYLRVKPFNSGFKPKVEL